MTGREFVKALEAQGFIVKRRCKSFVWVGRGEQQLMIDEGSTIPDAFLERLLGRSHPPPSARRHSRTGSRF